MLFLYLSIVATLLLDAVLIAALTWAHKSPSFAAYRIKPGPTGVPRKGRERTMAVIGVLSPALVFGLVALGRRSLFVDGPASAMRILGEVVGVILVYDFIYYWLHRLMHVKSLLRFVHGYHHRAKNPSALESFYQHPLEAVAGIALLFLVTFAIGPVHTVSFAIIFFVYSQLNILVHSGFDTRSKLFWPIDVITRRHHVHHSDDPEKNYASITPIPDWMFRTAR